MRRIRPLAAWMDRIRLDCLFRRQAERHQQGHRREKGRTGALRIAFVIPWYGRDISGGAEAEAYGLVHTLRRHAPDIQVEVLSTTLKEFAGDWNGIVHREGAHTEEGVTVRRFHPTRENRNHFHFINGTRLMPGGTAALWDPVRNSRRSPLPPRLEAYFLRRMVNSPDLLAFMEQRHDDYDAFVLIPYMFATTALGCAVAGPKAMLIPCLHDERYAYMDIYDRAFRQAGAVLCHVRSEAALFARLYPEAPPPAIIGEQVNTAVERGDAARFRAKYGIADPFILYAGRQVAGKNVPLLVEYFQAFRARNPAWERLKLVLIGKGDLDYSGTPGVIPLGFIPPEDKTDAYAAATCLAMLSVNESFSIVLMESWLQETPAIVSARCAVTRDHVEDSGGGFAVATEAEFSEALLAFLSDGSRRSAMGAKGRDYVITSFSPQKVASRFREELERLAAKSSNMCTPDCLSR